MGNNSDESVLGTIAICSFTHGQPFGGPSMALLFTQKRIIVVNLMSLFDRAKIAFPGAAARGGRGVGNTIFDKTYEILSKFEIMKPDDALKSDSKNFAIQFTEIKSIEFHRGSLLLKPTILAIKADKNYEFGIKVANSLATKIDDVSFKKFSDTIKKVLSGKLIILDK